MNAFYSDPPISQPEISIFLFSSSEKVRFLTIFGSQ